MVKNCSATTRFLEIDISVICFDKNKNLRRQKEITESMVHYERKNGGA